MTRVINTRPRQQAPALSEALRAAGFDPAEVPLVELALFRDALAILRKLPETLYDGVLLSSPNLLPLMREAEEGIPEAWKTKPWYLIGSRSRPDVESLGVKVAFVPEVSSLDGFLHEFPAREPGSPLLRLLHPCSAKTRLEPALFTSRGIDVHNMAVYEPRLPEGSAELLDEAWRGAKAALFASGSAVHHLFAAAPRKGRDLALGEGPMPISIGASTTRALRMYGVDRFAQCPTADNAGFVEALRRAITE
ncbi:MAG TPA: uroporphyrinogen-III synthase [Fibrobacteria bacterium]|jgi:uroporphyrinogen-III synthase|nr:uroporphyrinogen-III synthase [Fibrobacteria bacterium]